MATHSSFLAWRIPWTEVGYSPWGHKELDATGQLTLFTFMLSLINFNKKVTWKSFKIHKMKTDITARRNKQMYNLSQKL